MNRKPRVVRVPDVYLLDVAAYPDAIVGDVFVDDHKHKIEMRLAKDEINRDIWIEFDFTIDRSKTIDCVDPFDYYSNLLDAGVIDCMRVDPSNPVVRSRYPWMNAFWYVVNIYYGPDGPRRFAVEFTSRFEAEHFIEAERLEADVAAVHRRYVDFKAVQRSIFVRQMDMDCLTVVEKISAESSRLKQRDQRGYNVYHCHRKGLSLVIGFDTRYYAELVPFLRFLPSHVLLPLQHYIDWTAFDPTTRCLLGATRYDPCESQWLTYHRIIIDVSIALAVMDVPPYVLLEVLDWLPFFLYWRHARKLELIVSIRRSTEAIRARRQLRRSVRIRSIRAPLDTE